MPIGVDFDKKVFCQFCSEYFEKGTGHLCYCPECDALGKPCRHPMCDSCFKNNIDKGKIMRTEYTKIDIDDSLKDRLV